MGPLQRCYLFTGKGGVGKTTIAIAFAHWLQINAKKVLYVAIEDQKQSTYLNELKIDHTVLNLHECAQGYVAKKLRSETAAKWITSTSFFKAQLSMVPGFNYIIFLGYIMELLHDDPELIVVFDSPSSGHTLTMFDSFANFQEIFQSGFISQDIQKIIRFRDGEGILKVCILAPPTLMACHEGLELLEDLTQLGVKEKQFILNNSFSLLEPLMESRNDLPPFLQSKIELELQVKKELEINAFLPYSSSLEYKNIVEDLISYMPQLV